MSQYLAYPSLVLYVVVLVQLCHMDPGYYDWEESVFRWLSGCPKRGVASDFIIIIIIMYLAALLPALDL